jgi:hypothetical protein
MRARKRAQKKTILLGRRGRIARHLSSTSQRQNFSRIGEVNASLACCTGEAYHGTGVHDGPEKRTSSRLVCEAMCTSRKECQFYSWAQHEYYHRGGLCVFCKVCQLAARGLPRLHMNFSSWARDPGPFERVEEAQWVERLLAPLDLNGSYSVHLYGQQRRLPALNELRVLWLTLLTNTSLRALASRAPPCRLQAAMPFLPTYTVRDTVFATPFDSLWLRSGAERTARCVGLLLVVLDGPARHTE